MNKKSFFWKCAISICLLAGVVIAYKKMYANKFIPSAAHCGAALSSRGQQDDTFERGLACMLAGHKKVYLGNVAGILYERIPEQYASKQIQAFYLADGNFILYTDDGVKEAKLLAEQINSSYQNHYLSGKLLGYSEDDISFFYNRNHIDTFEQDKKAASKWIQEHTKL